MSLAKDRCSIKNVQKLFIFKAVTLILCHKEEKFNIYFKQLEEEALNIIPFQELEKHIYIFYFLSVCWCKIKLKGAFNQQLFRPWIGRHDISIRRVSLQSATHPFAFLSDFWWSNQYTHELYIKIKCTIYCKRSALLFEVTAANKSQLNKPQFWFTDYILEAAWKNICLLSG